MGAYNRQGGRVEKGRFFFWRKEMRLTERRIEIQPNIKSILIQF